ncbi:E3 ubiquitin-protein ligase AIP2 [Arachis duranensis]|uniref:E3 ubiquitin-protein ligase AIP2 n=1 Tax=Arachis duranensis TaxID=130453 RepID=A0A6P4BQN5_ARADU|nr:E3 ubiquitin-protein ligase AIP2 [Arachis duranensis]XP_025620256.1 E3 ubiquitin-protein ligase AIP2 [Arachis hypogaea]
MAGRLPGVGVPPRKRSSSSSSSSSCSSLLEHNHYNLATYRRVSLVETSALDETALKARQRLQKKLAQFFPSSRENENPIREGKVKKEKRDEGIIIGRKLLSNAWLMRAKKNERKVCAVCLEDFQQEKQIMNLSCSHKFHSACLLPWLQSHPHCPYCRTPVDAHTYTP